MLYFHRFSTTLCHSLPMLNFIRFIFISFTIFIHDKSFNMISLSMKDEANGSMSFIQKATAPVVKIADKHKAET